MKCYALGLGLDTFRMVALTQNFRRLDVGVPHERLQAVRVLSI